MNLIPSSRIESIFYGDLFLINKKGCLVFGSGKTKACRVASGNDDKNEIALDMVCITNDNNVVYGHNEFEFRAETVPDPIKDKVPLHYFIRMLNEEETKSLFGTNPLTIKKISYSDFVKLSKFNITYDFPPLTAQAAQNKINHFQDLTQGGNVETIIVPWFSNHQVKGQEIKNYIV